MQCQPDWLMQTLHAANIRGDGDASAPLLQLKHPDLRMTSPSSAPPASCRGGPGIFAGCNSSLLKETPIKLSRLSIPGIAIAMTSSLLLCPTGALANAQSAPIKETLQEKALQRFCTSGNHAMRDISSARAEIFDGNPQAAIKSMHAAKSYLA